MDTNLPMHTPCAPPQPPTSNALVWVHVVEQTGQLTEQWKVLTDDQRQTLKCGILQMIADLMNEVKPPSREAIAAGVRAYARSSVEGHACRTEQIARNTMRDMLQSIREQTWAHPRWNTFEAHLPLGWRAADLWPAVDTVIEELRSGPQRVEPPAPEPIPAHARNGARGSLRPPARYTAASRHRNWTG